MARTARVFSSTLVAATIAGGLFAVPTPALAGDSESALRDPGCASRFYLDKPPAGGAGLTTWYVNCGYTGARIVVDPPGPGSSYWCVGTGRSQSLAAGDVRAYARKVGSC